jgi:hypothetical protein
VGEWLAPALELIRTGSPIVSGFTGAWIIAGFLMREMRRHYAAEAQLRQERYDELRARHDLLAVKYDLVTEKWLTSEREKAELIRGSPLGTRKAGDS